MFNYLKLKTGDFGREVREGFAKDAKEDREKMKTKFLEFKNQFSSILEGFKEIKDGYEDEKLKMHKIWKQREKKLDRILINASEFYGALRGIAGASIPEIQLLEGKKEIELDELSAGDED